MSSCPGKNQAGSNLESQIDAAYRAELRIVSFSKSRVSLRAESCGRRPATGRVRRAAVSPLPPSKFSQVIYGNYAPAMAWRADCAGFSDRFRHPYGFRDGVLIGQEPAF